MAVITPLFLELVTKHGLKIDKRILEKLLSWKWTILYKTALKILKKAQEVSRRVYILKDLFYLNELRWYEIERKVIYTYTEKQLSDEDWASLIRYILEKRWYL